jgi:hypothetical protein
MFGGFSLSSEQALKADKASTAKSEPLDAEQAPTGTEVADAQALKADKASTAKSEPLDAEQAPTGTEAADAPIVLTRDQLFGFFESTISLLRSDAFRAEIVGAVTPDQRPDTILFEKQLCLLEQLGADREEGQAQLNAIHERFGDDELLLTKMKEFEATCNETFVCIFKSLQPSELKTEGPLTKAQVFEFFEACESLMQTAETKAKLAAVYAETKQQSSVSEAIISMQRDMIAALGFDRDYGVSQLNSHAASRDPDIERGMQMFARRAQMCCTEAIMGKEKFEARMKLQQQQMERQQRLVTEVEAMTSNDKREFMKKQVRVRQLRTYKYCHAILEWL